jgi:hypothetical protein
MGGSHITTQILRARSPANARAAWIAAIAIPLMLLAPALWNGYPLLQWDTGGYLARCYEGYLVPSRSTMFGLYLHFGEAATGPGRHWRRHRCLARPYYGIIERFLPAQMKPMRAAQQHWHFDFTVINRIHIPVALASMLLAAILFGYGVLRRPFDDLTLLAGTVTFAVLGNAFICAVISGPHDRYGARLAWLATTVVLIAAVSNLLVKTRASAHCSRDRKSVTPVL